LEINNEIPFNNNRMSYEQLLERSVEAQTRGNDELAKALFERAMDLKSRRQESPESKEEYKSDA